MTVWLDPVINAKRLIDKEISTKFLMIDSRIFVPAVHVLFENRIRVSYFVSDWKKRSDQSGLCHQLLFASIKYLNVDETVCRKGSKMSLRR